MVKLKLLKYIVHYMIMCIIIIIHWVDLNLKQGAEVNDAKRA